MKNKEIKEEILKISETVTNQMPDKRNFNIPEGYFDELNDKVMAQATISQFVRNPEYHIPEGYFEDNEEKWMAQHKKPLFILKWWKQMAAIFILAVFCLFLFRKEKSNQNEDVDIALMYLNDNMYKMETDELIDYQLIQEEDITLIEQEYEYEFLDFDSLESALEL
ncbi:MAG: hypothetical protein IPG79_00300 [Saprospiraceae bacterium]|nr:hypothetical protein [Saprospiraceae bacterium]MBK6782353.1 hypothetical protein [Saprospiraceae bacterium]